MQRRSFLKGIVALVAAPAIVRLDSIMPVRLVRWMPGPALIIDAMWEWGEGNATRWTAQGPYNAVVVLPGQKIADRVNQTLPGMRPHGPPKSLMVDIDGHKYYTEGSRKPLIPLSTNSPLLYPLT